MNFKMVILFIIIILILVTAVITVKIYFQPLIKTNEIIVSSTGIYEPVPFKGANYYFILNKNDSKVIILDITRKTISIPDSDSIISILGLKLWKKGSRLGIPITSYPVEEDANIVWKQDSVSFTHFQSRFTVKFK